jgi:hypothetical protein
LLELAKESDCNWAREKLSAVWVDGTEPVEVVVVVLPVELVTALLLLETTVDGWPRLRT